MAPNYPPNFDWRGSGGISVREACRRRQPMSGAEAQAMEGALAETERERDTLIRQRAADLEALNAVQALHAQAVAERDEARRQVEALREAIEEVLSWKRTDMTALMSNPPQNAALVNAQRVLSAALDALAVPSTNGGG